ncbi:MAG: outer membrane beta-barrel protein [Bacteroidia bacterium]|nr:outer membrane beta-barrel protein [Bacteroidia bacterium]
MKKLIFTSLLMISMLSIANGQFTKIGGGLALSSGFPFHNMPWEANKSGKIAISFKGIYEISVPLHISPSFTVFYPNITKEQSGTTTVSSLMFDINGHYVFNSLDRFEFYGLAGLDILYTRKKATYTTSPANAESDNALGINIGAGTYMKIAEQIDLYGEVKYIISKYDQLMVNVGVLINIDFLKKNKNSGK